MDDVDIVDHEVGEDAAAEIPKPAPITEAVFVEGLVGSAAEEGFPLDAAGIDIQQHSAHAVRIAVPGQVDLEDLAEPARANDVAALFELRHASLLHADL